MAGITLSENGKGKGRRRADHEGPEREYRCSSTLSSNSALDGGGCSTPRPGRFTSRKETPYPLSRSLGGPHGRSWRVRKISPPSEIDPHAVQARSNYPVLARQKAYLN